MIVRSSGFDVSPIQHAARDTLRDLERGHVDLAMNRMWFADADADDARPGVTLVAGLCALDAALRRRFGDGLPDAPLPSADEAFASVTMTAGQDDVALAGPRDHQVALVRRDGTWRVDGRPFVDPAIGPDAAEAMRGELSRLAGRVDAGRVRDARRRPGRVPGGDLPRRARRRRPRDAAGGRRRFDARGGRGPNFAATAGRSTVSVEQHHARPASRRQVLADPSGRRLAGGGGGGRGVLAPARAARGGARPLRDPAAGGRVVLQVPRGRAHGRRAGLRRGGLAAAGVRRRPGRRGGGGPEPGGF